MNILKTTDVYTLNVNFLYVNTYFFLKKEGKTVNVDFTGEKLEFKSTV